MMGVREALIGTIGTALVPAVLLAQTPTQMEVLNQTLARCTDTSTLPGDWTDVFSDWTAVARDDETAANAYLAADLMLIYGADEEYVGETTLLEKTEFLLEFESNFAWDKPYFLENPDEFGEVFFTHPTGWQVAVLADPEDIAFNYCWIWHPAPDAAVIDELQAAYLIFEPVDVVFGTYSYADIRQPDADEFAYLDVEILVTDDLGVLPSAALSSHPVRYVPPVFVSLFFSAYSRETQ